MSARVGAKQRWPLSLGLHMCVYLFVHVFPQTPCFRRTAEERTQPIVLTPLSGFAQKVEQKQVIVMLLKRGWGLPKQD